MKKFVNSVLATVLIAVSSSAVAGPYGHPIRHGHMHGHAHRHHHGGGNWVAPLVLLGVGAAAASAWAVQRPAPAPVYVTPTPPPPPMWYYCRSAGAYHPWAQVCPEGWEPVPARP